MLKIKKDGYVISQASNNHVMICKDDEMLFHMSCNKEKTKEELEEVLEFYFMLIRRSDIFEERVE